MLGVEVTAYLAAQGFGTVNVNLFYHDVPADPDVLISIMGYGGGHDEPNLGEGGTLTRLETIRFQAITRGIARDSDGPELKCINVRKALVAVLNQSLSGVRYLGIDCLTPPSKLIVDENFRVYWAANFQAMKVPSTS